MARFGKGPYRGAGALLHFEDGQQPEPVQGPDSKRLKYGKTLCSTCNNSGTQAHDRAYEVLMQWIRDNEAKVLTERLVDFRDVFGDEWPTRVDDVIRYYCKSLGCRIRNADRPVPLMLRLAAANGPLSPCIQVSFAVHEELAELREHMTHYAGKTDLAGNLNPDAAPFYEWAEKVSWFTAVVRYRVPHDPLDGTLIGACSPVAHLGSFTTCPEGWREELMAREGQEQPPKALGSDIASPASPATIRGKASSA